MAVAQETAMATTIVLHVGAMDATARLLQEDMHQAHEVTTIAEDHRPTPELRNGDRTEIGREPEEVCRQAMAISHLVHWISHLDRMFHHVDHRRRLDEAARVQIPTFRATNGVHAILTITTDEVDLVTLTPRDHRIATLIVHRLVMTIARRCVTVIAITTVAIVVATRTRDELGAGVRIVNVVDGTMIRGERDYRIASASSTGDER